MLSDLLRRDNSSSLQPGTRTVIDGTGRVSVFPEYIVSDMVDYISFCSKHHQLQSVVMQAANTSDEIRHLMDFFVVVLQESVLRNIYLRADIVRALVSLTPKCLDTVLPAFSLPGFPLAWQSSCWASDIVQAYLIPHLISLICKLEDVKNNHNFYKLKHRFWPLCLFRMLVSNADCTSNSDLLSVPFSPKDSFAFSMISQRFFTSFDQESMHNAEFDRMVHLSLADTMWSVQELERIADRFRTLEQARYRSPPMGLERQRLRMESHRLQKTGEIVLEVLLEYFAVIYRIAEAKPQVLLAAGMRAHTAATMNLGLATLVLNKNKEIFGLLNGSSKVVVLCGMILYAYVLVLKPELHDDNTATTDHRHIEELEKKQKLKTKKKKAKDVALFVDQLAIECQYFKGPIAECFETAYQHYKMQGATLKLTPDESAEIQYFKALLYEDGQDKGGEIFHTLCIDLAASAAAKKHNEENLKEVPEEFLDPLLSIIMIDPVKLPSGHTVDRSVIERHLASTPQDPFSRQPCTKDMLVPDTDMRRSVIEWMAQHRPRELARLDIKETLNLDK